MLMTIAWENFQVSLTLHLIKGLGTNTDQRYTRIYMNPHDLCRVDLIIKKRKEHINIAININ